MATLNQFQLKLFGTENFGDLAKGVAEGKVTLQGGDFKTPELNKPIETAEN